MEIQQRLAMLLVICLGIGVIEVSILEAAEPSNLVANIAIGNNAFAIAVYQQMAETASGNLLLCPYSIRTALLMTFAGARGETAQQMIQALHIPEPVSEIHQAAQAWQASLNAQTGSELHAANALWSQQGSMFQADFVEQVNAAYAGGLHDVDFTGDIDAARCTINAWVAAETGGKIADFLKPRALEPSVRLVLTNAVYFKGTWEFPFDPQRTTPAPFTILSDQAVVAETVEVPMMSQILTTAYSEDDGQQIIELPYVGQRLAMVLVLPKERDGLRQFEQLSAPALADMLARLQPQKVMVMIPRWSMEFEAALPQALRNLGLNDAFALPPADFSGMTGGKDLYISEVLHKAVLDVNEAGTEAAAATEVTMSRGLQRNPMFVADHPFLVIIRDQQTDGILFIGRVLDPRG